MPDMAEGGGVLVSMPLPCWLLVGFRELRDIHLQLARVCSWMSSVAENVMEPPPESLREGGIAEKFEQHGEAFTGFVGDVQASILSQLNAQSVGPEGFVENFHGELRVVE